MKNARPILSLLVSLALLGALLQACGGSEPGEAPARYALRGVVKDVGGEGDEARATIQHEAIPTFKDRKGREVGMEPMTMAFGLDAAVDREALKTGAKVEMVVEVDWSREPALMIKKAGALPDDTTLEL